MTRQLASTGPMPWIQGGEPELSGPWLELLRSDLCFLRWSVKSIGYGHRCAKMSKTKQTQMKVDLRQGSRRQ